MIKKETLASAIIRNASRFVGLRETKPNASWDNPKTPGPDAELVKELRAMMRPAPWEDGWAYCAAFAEGIVVKALRDCGATPEQVAKFARVMGPGCVNAANAFARLSFLMSRPADGAIWLARHGTTSNGHAGIVTAYDALRMSNVEANTSKDSNGTDSAKEREGDWITTKLRPISGQGKLITMGFVTPEAILKLIYG